jgi:hypothetical protein
VAGPPVLSHGPLRKTSVFGFALVQLEWREETAYGVPPSLPRRVWTKGERRIQYGVLDQLMNDHLINHSPSHQSQLMKLLPPL